MYLEVLKEEHVGLAEKADICPSIFFSGKRIFIPQWLGFPTKDIQWHTRIFMSLEPKHPDDLQKVNLIN